MSLLPYVFREMIRPMRMMEQQLRMVPEEFFRPFPIQSVFRFPVNQGQKLEYKEEDGEAITTDQEKFQISLDVKNFAPEELSVKTNDDNSVTIEGKHEEKQDNHGYISRHFIRRFLIPKGHEMQNIVSTLSSDGILTVVAPKLPEIEKERSIPITHVQNAEQDGKTENDGKQ